MALSRQVVEQIKDLLRQNPQGLSITDIARTVDINRNTAGRYLDKLLLSGQVEMHHFGMAKLFRLSERLPVSAVLSISSELVLQLDSSLRIIFINDPFLDFIRATAKDIVGKNIEYTVISSIFEDIFSDLLGRLREGVAGTEWRGELSLPERRTVFFCRIAPTVFNEGPKGVSVLFEDISDRKRDEEQIRQSEARVRSIIRVAPIGIGVIRDRVFLEVNARFCQITGYTAAELLGQSARMLYLTREEYDRVGVVKYGLIRDHGTGSVETQWRRKDKKIIDVLVSSTPLDPADLSSGVTFTALDITERKRAERALFESEVKLRSIAENSPDMILLLNPELEIIFISRTFTQNSNEVCGRSVYDYIPQEYHAAAAACFDHVLKTGKPAIYYTEYHYATGKTAYFESTVGPVFQEKTVTALVINARDITERKKAEKEIAESEDRYRNLVEISPDAVILHRDDTIIYVNPAAVSLLGARNPEEIIGKSVFEFIQPEHREAVRANIKKDLGGEITPPIELQMLQIDGTPIVVEGRGVKTYLDGKPAVQVALTDITERKLSETRLRESEQRYHQLADSSLDAIIISDLAGKVLTTNRAALEMFEIDMPVVPGRIGVFDFVAPESRETAKQHFTEMTWEKKGVMRTYNAISARGKRLIVEVIGNRITFGLAPAKIISVRDVSERKRMEADLIESERKYKLLADTSIDIITLQKPDTTAIFVSPAVTSLLGYTPEELIGKPVIGYVHPEETADVRSVILGLMQGTDMECLFVFRIRHSDGHYVWFESTTRIIRDETGAVKELISVSRDITGRKQAEEALRESEERYRRLLEQSFDAIAIHKEGKITLVNDATVAIMGGSSPEEFIGRSIYDFIHPDSQPVAKERLSRDTGTLPLVKEKFVRIDGTPVDVEVMSTRFMDNGIPAVQVVFRKIPLY